MSMEYTDTFTEYSSDFNSLSAEYEELEEVKEDEQTVKGHKSAAGSVGEYSHEERKE